MRDTVMRRGRPMPRLSGRAVVFDHEDQATWPEYVLRLEAEAAVELGFEAAAVQVRVELAYISDSLSRGWVGHEVARGDGRPALLVLERAPHAPPRDRTRGRHQGAVEALYSSPELDQVDAWAATLGLRRWWASFRYRVLRQFGMSHADALATCKEAVR